MQASGSLEWWETPLARENYKHYFVTQGSWQNNTFTVPVDCSRDTTVGWDRWLCAITRSVWVRVIADEAWGVWLESLQRPEGAVRSPFYRVVGSDHAAMYEKYLRGVGRLKADDLLREYLIASMENEIHILSFDEPSFSQIKPAAN